RNNKFELCELCTGFSFSFLVFHRVTTRVNDAANSGSIRLWYPIPFQRKLRGEGKLQLLRGKNVSRRGEVELRLFLQGEVIVTRRKNGIDHELRLFLRGNIFLRRGRSSCNCCEEISSCEGEGRVAVVSARGG